MYSQIYNFGPRAPPQSSPQDNLAQNQLFKAIEQDTGSQQQHQQHYLPSSLIHVQGSSGSLSGTLPTFTFMPPQHQPSQLPLQISVQPVMKVNSEAMEQEIPFRHNTVMPMCSEENTSHQHHGFGHFASIEESPHDMLTNFASSFGNNNYHSSNGSSGAIHHAYYHNNNNSTTTGIDIISEMSSSSSLSLSSSSETTVPARLPPLMRINNQHSESAVGTSGITLPTTNSDNKPDIKRQCLVIPKGHTQRAPWTPTEDNLLRLAVQLYGDKTEKWSKIAACVPGRTNKNCRKRWFHSLDPSLRKGAWTDEEDQSLREGVMKYPNQWSKIADMLVGRTDDQCAKRWRESLDPNIDRSEWTVAEDQLLIAKYDEYGSQWQKIAHFFEGRPGLHCRNRWRKLQRLMQMKKEKEDAAASMTPFVDGLTEHMQRTSTLHSNGNTSNSYSPRPPLHHNPYEQHSSSETSSLCSSISPALMASQSHLNFPPVIVGGDRGVCGCNSTIGDGDVEQQQNDPLSNMVPYGCDIPGCFASFPQSNGLFYHMKSAHPNLDGYNKPYRCAMPNCTKRYKNINGLQYHLREAKGSSGHAPYGSRAHTKTLTR